MPLDSTILIVEDELEWRYLLKYELGKHYKTHFAEDGLEALNLIDKEIPDLIVADLMIPKIDGITLHIALRRREETKFIPIIFVSVLEHSVATKWGLREQQVLDFYIRKEDVSKNFEKLLARIDHYLARSLFLRYGNPGRTSLTSLKVFLCYASEDRASVLNMYRQLKGEGIEPWMDKDMLAGQHWEQVIEQRMKESHLILICLSRDSVEKTGFVQVEVSRAMKLASEQPDGAIFIIPVRLQECTVPDRLQHLHWVDLFEENGFDKLLESLRDCAATHGLHLWHKMTL